MHTDAGSLTMVSEALDLETATKHLHAERHVPQSRPYAQIGVGLSASH